MMKNAESSPAQVISIAIASQVVKHAPLRKNSVHIAPRETVALRRFQSPTKGYAGKRVFAAYDQSHR
jgi:hypothetical protein